MYNKWIDVKGIFDSGFVLLIVNIYYIFKNRDLFKLNDNRLIKFWSEMIINKFYFYL